MNQATNPYVMLHDEKRCIGCQACTVACKVLNDVPEGFSRLQVQIRSPEHETRGAIPLPVCSRFLSAL